MNRIGYVATTAITAAAVVATVVWFHHPTDWGFGWTSSVALAMLLVGVWLLVAATVVLGRWRPSSRLWMLMATLSLAWSWFVVLATSSVDPGGLSNSAVVFRPVLFALLLAWPSGRLRRADRGWWAGYSVLQAALFWMIPQLLEEWDSRPLVITDLQTVAEIARSFGAAVVLPVGGVLLYVSIRRHAGALPPTGRWLYRPVVTAALITMVSELFTATPNMNSMGFDDEGRPNSFGGLFLISQYAPYVVTPILAVIAMRRARSMSGAPTSIEIGPVRNVLRDALGAAEHGASVWFAGPAGSWLDRAGRPIPPPDQASVVEIRRDDGVVAMVGAGATSSPDEIERAVAAAGASVDFARLEASSNAGQRAALAARRAMSDARDAALSRLERDLHDGAQQRLVGLAIQASIARRSGPDDGIVEDLRSGIAAARAEIAEAASGLLPAVVATRGLAASIASLAACTSMNVELDVDLPAGLPNDIAAAAWFVAAESVANATKHAEASRLRISGSVVNGDLGGRHLDMIIDDDGCGGADENGSGLAGMRTRVRRVGGDLSVSSPVAGGTVVHATFPLRTPIGATL